MTMEYEKFILSLLTSLAVKKQNKGYYVIADEVEEVYRKAKAWDNYLADVENSVREVTGNEDEVKWHVDYAINEYMEDK